MLHAAPDLDAQLPGHRERRFPCAVGCAQRAGQHLAAHKGGVVLGHAGQLQRLLHGKVLAAHGQLAGVGVLAAYLDLQGPLHTDLPGGRRCAADYKAAGDVQHAFPGAGQRRGGLGSQRFFLGHGALQALHRAGVLLNAAVGQCGQQLGFPPHGHCGAEDVRAAQVDAVLTDGAAVAVFRFAPDLSRAVGVLPGGQLDQFFKGEFLLGAQKARAGLLALVIDGAAQIAFALPASAGHTVLQHDGRDQALDDFEYGGQVVGNQDLRFHGKLQPCFPASAVGCDGVFEHLEFHIACPFPVMFWGIICGRAKK